MSAPVLSADRLTVELGSGPALLRAVDGVGFEIARGETFALVGESGCGKSMTAAALMRLLPEVGRITDGSVRSGGTELLGLPESAMRDVRGRRIAMIFQEPATCLNPVLTVGRQIGEVLARHRGLRGAAARTRTLELLDAVGIPDRERRIDDYAFQLSGGMKQRVMIAMALAGEPEVLIADEPTTALDVSIQAQVLDLLRNVQRANGMAILLITHDLGIVSGIADRIAVMYAGEIVEVAATAAFFRSPQHPYSRKLLAALPGAVRRGARLAVIPGQATIPGARSGCRFADRCDEALPRCRREAPTLSEPGPGHRVRCHLVERGVREYAREAAIGGAPARSTTAAAGMPPLAPLLEVRGLKVHFPIRRGILRRVVGHVRAVDGVSLTIAPGRTLALVGESGCGKTTVGKAILQLLRPTAGEVGFGGDDLTQLRGERLRAHRAGLQIIFQDPYASLNPRMRVADILVEGMNALRVPDSPAAREARAVELLERVGLGREALGRYPHEFSGGQRQRIAIARALAVNPKLIVCDEPTSALDVSVQAQILNLLSDLQARLDLAYLFISHNLAVVDHLAHEVAVMYLGRIVERGTVDEVLRTPRHPYTQALLAAVPRIEAGKRGEGTRLTGELPSPVSPPSGCHFHPRCPHATARCREAYPLARAFSETHAVTCHFPHAD